MSPQPSPPPPVGPQGPDFSVLTPAIVRGSFGERAGDVTIDGVWVTCKGDDGVWRSWPSDDVQSIEWQ